MGYVTVGQQNIAATLVAFQIKALVGTTDSCQGVVVAEFNHRANEFNGVDGVSVSARKVLITGASRRPSRI